MNLSVIICTHNPRKDYLARALDALKAQTLSKAQWELLLIDNASKEPLAGQWDLSWQPAARIIREEELGLTPARLRGIREAKGELLVFVDDDNVLAGDYLAEALKVASEKPFLGAWGPSILGEFEVSPPAWLMPWLEYLAVREVKNTLWTNDQNHWKAIPYGAGLCVRRPVANAYAEAVRVDPIRRGLGRRGASYMSGEDIDLVRTGLRMGYGCGVLTQLQLTHLISKPRLDPAYVTRLVVGSRMCIMLLEYSEGMPIPKKQQGMLYQLRRLKRLLQKGKVFAKLADTHNLAVDGAWEALRPGNSIAHGSLPDLPRKA